MIKGILTFKPLATGEVQIMIKGGAGDIPELARLYGKEVQISLAVEQAQVQADEMEGYLIRGKAIDLLEAMLFEMRNLHDKKIPPETNQVQD